MAQWIMDSRQVRRFDYTVLEARLEDITTEAGARRFLSELPGQCPHDPVSFEPY